MNLAAYLVDLHRSTALRNAVYVLLATCAGLLIWPLLPRHAKTPAIAAATPAPQARLNISAIAGNAAAAHIFGQATTAADTAAPVSAASITVQALFYSTDKDVARAILEINGKADVFKSGDTLPDGEKLAAIGMNAVQIANGGALREVQLEQKFGNSGEGISLTGMPELYAAQQSFPGPGTPAATADPAVQKLRQVTIPQGGDPIAQMRALREQLIKH